MGKLLVNEKLEKWRKWKFSVTKDELFVEPEGASVLKSSEKLIKMRAIEDPQV